MSMLKRPYEHPRVKQGDTAGSRALLRRIYCGRRHKQNRTLQFIGRRIESKYATTGITGDAIDWAPVVPTDIAKTRALIIKHAEKLGSVGNYDLYSFLVMQKESQIVSTSRAKRDEIKKIFSDLRAVWPNSQQTYTVITLRR